MRTIAALCIAALTLGGCASVSKTVTGPGGYEYKESIIAIFSVEKAANTFGGTLEVYGEDGKPLVKATLDSQQVSEGVTSDAPSTFEGLKLLGHLMTGTP